MPNLTTQLNTLKAHQQEFYKTLTEMNDPQLVKDLFLAQHARLHSARVTGGSEPLISDALVEYLSDSQLQGIPYGQEHSLLWCLWHLARIEDLVLNVVVAGGHQVWEDGGWGEKLCFAARHTGQFISEDELDELNETMDIEALMAYRDAVGKRTQTIVSGLAAEALRAPVSRENLKMVESGKWVLQDSMQGSLDFWGGFTNLAGLLGVPPSFHLILHLEEMLAIRNALLGE